MKAVRELSAIVVLMREVSAEAKPERRRRTVRENE
jgi:hypothetical protein